MSLALVKKDIESNRVPLIYLWHGEDRYSLTEALKLLKGVFLVEDPSGSGIEAFRGKDSSVQDIIEAANTSSFFSGKLVIVDDIPYFNQNKGKNGTETEAETGNEDDEEQEVSTVNREGDADVLVKYLQNPNPATRLVLISNKVNKGRKLYKEIAKAGKVIEFSYPKGQTEWLAWIQKEAKSRDKTMNPATATFLVEWAGHNTGILSQELEKISLYIGKRQEIRTEDIREISVPLIETTIFAMLDAIAVGNTAEALQKLTEVLSQEYHLKVHTMIVRQVRLLLAGNLMRGQGATVEKFMEVTGIKSSFEGNKIFRQAARFSPEKLVDAMEDCLQTELSLKSSGGKPDLLLEMMVIRFCQRA